MATQGIISILVKGEVVMKIIAGSGGYNAQVLADRLKSEWPVANIGAAYRIAQEEGFGSPEDLVVLTPALVKYEGEDELHVRYRQTFGRPEFNPRWERGTADHVVLVEV